MSVELICLESSQDSLQLPIRLKKASKVRFTIGATLEGKKIDLFTNYPSNQVSFDRNCYRKLKWKCKRENESLLFFDIKFQIPGTFRYYFTETNSSDGKILGEGYCLVSPSLKFDNGDELPLHAIQCQTLRVDCLGSIDELKQRIQLAHETAFNCIHFTPIQEVKYSPYLITDHFKVSSAFDSSQSFDNFKQIVNCINKEWKMFSITDVVLHEVCEDSSLLKENLNVALNLNNSPHLRPAYLFDRVLSNLTVDILEGKYNSIGIKKEINCEEHLKKLKILLKETYVREARIHELFLLDIETVLSEYRDYLTQYIRGKLNIASLQNDGDGKEVKVIQDVEYRRHKSKVNVCPFVHKAIEEAKDSNHKCEEWVNTCCQSFRQSLDSLNAKIMSDVNSQLLEAIENIINLIRIERVDEKGPKIPFISKDEPLIASYFTDILNGEIKNVRTIKQIEESMYDSRNNIYIALRSFYPKVTNSDENESETKYDEPAFNEYLKREMKVKKKSVKLNFNEKKEDSKFIFDHLKRYIETTAKIFHGFVINDVSSIAPHALTYFIDLARSVNPDCFIIGEMPNITCQSDVDLINTLGLSAVIRCSLNVTSVSKLGSFVKRSMGDIWPKYSFNDDYLYLQPRIPVINCVSTPKNECKENELSVFHLTAATALVAMSRSAIASFRGHEELMLNNKANIYTKWDAKYSEYGSIILRTFLNKLHHRISQSYNEIYVDEVDDNIISVSRHNPLTHNSVVLIARTAFTNNVDSNVAARLIVPGRINKILLQSTVTLKSGQFVYSNRFDLTLEETTLITSKKSGGENKVDFVDFKPGTILILDVSVHASTKRKNSYVLEKSLKSNKM
ncbi:glycogen debranching enzyme-like protein [Leptotrombidium deliense]|uniref:Glycogen debranching enzyme-like protein n=1 Tax=Leptotrombidium deliense TaxID=299467 RepID=A0A443SGS5_9ACAR|nr:glycogen debranching enzyme-like protein [Leptotrombidium deliense]